MDNRLYRVTEVGIHDGYRGTDCCCNLIGKWVDREVWGLHGTLLPESNGFEFGSFLCVNTRLAGDTLVFHAVKTEWIDRCGIARALGRGC